MEDKPKKSSFSDGIFEQRVEKKDAQRPAAQAPESETAKPPSGPAPAAPAEPQAAQVERAEEQRPARGEGRSDRRRGGRRSSRREPRAKRQPPTEPGPGARPGAGPPAEPEPEPATRKSEEFETISDVEASEPLRRGAPGGRQPEKEPAKAGKPVVKKMLINVVEPEETRIAVLENDSLEELYIERSSSDRNVGNIYKGHVTNVEPGIQAAFIDIGLTRNGFLHVSDVVTEEDRRAGGEEGPNDNDHDRRRRSRHPHAPIQQLLHRGDDVVVQITRAGLGNKGPSLTTHISLPGRYMVLMPMDGHHGVSRKILDDKLRDRLRKTVNDLAPRVKHGFIARTAAATAAKRELERDLRYLERLWQDIETRLAKLPAPAALYTESDLVLRCLRDVLAPDTEEIIIDSEDEAKKVRDFLGRFSRTSKTKLKLYTGHTPLFHKYHLEPQIEQIHQAKIPLSQGGSTVIQQTEAMVAIDVNSGRFIEETDPEDTAFKTNMEAAPEIARQLRLRDLGGVIVIDFIDMLQARHCREVERALAQAMKRDRARSTTLRMSRFCLVEMTRQRVRTSLERAAYETCPTCAGRGIVKSVESVALDVMRKIKLGLHRDHVEQVEAVVHPNVAWYLQNRKRRDLAQLETDTQREVSVVSDDTKGPESCEIVCLLDDGRKQRV